MSINHPRHSYQPPPPRGRHHPERSRSSGAARDLPQIDCIQIETQGAPRLASFARRGIIRAAQKLYSVDSTSTTPAQQTTLSNTQTSLSVHEIMQFFPDRDLLHDETATDAVSERTRKCTARAAVTSAALDRSTPSGTEYVCAEKFQPKFST